MSAAQDDPRPGDAPPPDLILRIEGSEGVYQSAGDQYIYEAGPTGPAVGSRGLPRDIATFVGRDDELHAVTSRVEQVIDHGAILPIVMVSGMPGVGKTALAVHAGHRLAEFFPDAQYFLDLRGHSAGSDGGLEPADALESLLMADGVESARIAVGIENRAAQWRSRLAGRQCLIILDNAERLAQVEPLLPGDPRCMTIVTSRNRLTGISASHTTITVPLATLAPDAAADLFGRLSGRDPRGDERASISALVQACHLLPLAICPLAAELRPEPDWRVADLLREYRQTTPAGSLLGPGERAVASAFQLSYSRLSPPLRRLFRQLGLHPGTELDAEAAAALSMLPVSRAGRYLALLYENHLLDQPRRGRFRLHDLVAGYIRHLLSDESPRQRQVLLGRIADHYLARAAGDWELITGEHSGGESEQARVRLEAERENLFACADALSVAADHRRVVAFAAGLAPVLRHTGPWDRAIRLQRSAATAAEHLLDPTGTAHALRELGVLYRLTGAYSEALEVLRRALKTDQDRGDDAGAAATLIRLGAVRRQAGDVAGAVETLHESLGISRRLADVGLEADALDELGVALSLSGDQRQAIECLQQALEVHRSGGSRRAYADTLNQLGAVWQMLSDYPAAITAHSEALAVYRSMHDIQGESRARNYLGAALVETGDLTQAAEVLQAAVPLLERLGNPLGHANALNYLGVVAVETGAYQVARERLDRALAIYRSLGYAHGEADAVNHLAVLDGRTGDPASAVLAHHRALAGFVALNHLPGQAEVLIALGELELRRDRLAEAAEHYEAALNRAELGGCPGHQARAHAGLGRCAMLARVDVDPAVHLLRAEDLYRRVGAVQAADAVAALLIERRRAHRPPIAS